MKTLAEVETAKEVYAELEAAGVTGAAADLVVKRTAHHRQGRRERAAYEAAVAWATAQTVGDPLPGRDASADEAHEGALAYLADVAASAWLACVLDASGVGGHMGLEGAKRARHPAFRVAAPKWGSGECWTAAIRTAAQRLELEALLSTGLIRRRPHGYDHGSGYRFLQLGIDGEGDLIVVTPDHASDDTTPRPPARPHRIVMGGYGCPPDREWRRAALACWLLAKLNGPAGGGLELTSARPDAERVPWCHCPQCSDPALIARALNDTEGEIAATAASTAPEEVEAEIAATAASTAPEEREAARTEARRLLALAAGDLGGCPGGPGECRAESPLCGPCQQARWDEADLRADAAVVLARIGETIEDLSEEPETCAQTHDRLDEQGVPRRAPCPTCGRNNERWLSRDGAPLFHCADAYGADACASGLPARGLPA